MFPTKRAIAEGRGAESSPARRGGSVPYPLVLFLAVQLLYLNSLFNGFVWDDHYMVEENASIRSLSQAPRYFTDARTMASIQDFRFYRPVRTLSLAIDYAVWRLSPVGYHLTNVLLHGGVTVLLFLMLVHLTGQRALAFVLSLLFMSHPGMAEAVLWVKGRDDVLCTLWFTAAFFVYVGNGAWGVARFSAVILLLSLALFSKEMAIAFFPLALGYDLITRRRVSFRQAAVLGCALLMSAAFLAVRSHVLRDIPVGVPTGPLSGLPAMKTLEVLGIYARLVVLPFRHTIDYLGVRETRSPLAMAVGAGSLALGAAAFVGLIRHGRRPAAFGLFWFGVTLSPMLLKNALAALPTTQLVAERFLYLPLIGIVLCAGGLCPDSDRGRRWVMLLAAAVAACFAAQTFRLTFRWRHDESVFAASLETAPASYRVLECLADVHLKKGNFDAVVSLFRTHPDLTTSKGRAMAGFADFMAGRREAGLGVLADVLRSAPDTCEAHVYSGVASGLCGRHDDAIRHLKEALERAPDQRLRSIIMNNLGIAYRSKGDAANALHAFESARLDSPLDREILRNLGALYWQLERWKEAAGVYATLKDLDAGEPSWRAYHSMAMERVGRQAPPR